MKLEQIDTPSHLKGKSEKYIKKQTHKLRRREIKAFLKGFRKTEPNDKQFLDSTM